LTLTVAVRVPASLRTFAGGHGVVHVDLGPSGPSGGSADVAALLDHLAVAYPALERRVRDEQGRLRPHVNLFVGTVNIRDLDRLATTLADGSEVVILPAVSGG
jgi:molybdopterin synthase sulfur carrier subunit